MAGASGPDGPDATANLIWSAKESALKVLRTGLRADTRTVEVALADGGAVDTRAGMAGLGRGGGRRGAGRCAGGRCAGADGAGWRRLTVTGARGTFPGWWRRDGVFVLTVVASAGPDGASRGAARLGTSGARRAGATRGWPGRWPTERAVVAAVPAGAGGLALAAPRASGRQSASPTMHDPVSVCPQL